MWVGNGEEGSELADKPGSVAGTFRRAAIHLGPSSPTASSGLPESGTDHTLGFLFGLAPGGVCLATGVATRAVRSYRTLSPLPRSRWRLGAGLEAVCSLLHFP